MNAKDIIEDDNIPEETLKKKININGKEYIVAVRCELNGRVFIITTERKIFECLSDSEYKECTGNDTETAFLTKHIRPSKSLDIER